LDAADVPFIIHHYPNSKSGWIMVEL
jgi:hypothetical protein